MLSIQIQIYDSRLPREVKTRNGRVHFSFWPAEFTCARCYNLCLIIHYCRVRKSKAIKLSLQKSTTLALAHSVLSSSFVMLDAILILLRAQFWELCDEICAISKFRIQFISVRAVTVVIPSLNHVESIKSCQRSPSKDETRRRSNAWLSISTCPILSANKHCCSMFSLHFEEIS